MKDRTPDKPPIAIELHCGDAPVVIETAGGKVREGFASKPDLTLTGAL
ncbi:MAG TPA: hypothetical protein VGK04_05165 [Thermoanaerobaculia bacterium]